MKIVNDMLIDTQTMDLQIKDGDFVVGDSTFQHQQHLLLAAKGDYKYAPEVGVDAVSQLHSSNTTLARDARVQFIKDGMTVNAINIVNDKLIFDANY